MFGLKWSCQLEDRENVDVVVLVILMSNCTASLMKGFFPGQVSKEILVGNTLAGSDRTIFLCSFASVTFEHTLLPKQIFQPLTLYNVYLYNLTGPLTFGRFDHQASSCSYALANATTRL
jgi:hypothetical protein